MNEKYSIVLLWSPDDEAYIARVNELPGCFADGATAVEAVAALDLVIEDWVEEAQRLKKPLPRAFTTQSVEQVAEAAAQQFRAFMQAQVDKLVEQAKQQIQLNPALATYDPADFWKTAS